MSGHTLGDIARGIGARLEPDKRCDVARADEPMGKILGLHDFVFAGFPFSNDEE